MTLQASQLAYARGSRTLFEDVSFEVAPGEALRVAGRNGSGKTSLLRLLCGLAQPLKGEVLWQGAPLRHRREAYQQGLIYIGHAQGLKDELTALENVQISALLSGHACTQSQAREALNLLGLEGRAHLPARVLSQGQRRRVVLSRLALPREGAAAPRILVLDEPFVALDHESVAVLTGLLEAGIARGDTLVYTTHQAQVLGQGAVKELLLDAPQSGPQTTPSDTSSDAPSNTPLTAEAA